MSSIHQFQRRAVESLRFGRDDLPASFSPASFALNDERPLYFCGTSEGIGTCADIQGMWVAVFGLVQPSPKVPVGRHLSECRYAVLLRDATPGERSAFPQGHIVCLECVERLDFKSFSNGTASFALSGRSKCYVPTFG